MTYWDYFIKALGTFSTPAFVGIYGAVAILFTLVLVAFLTLGA